MIKTAMPVASSRVDAHYRGAVSAPGGFSLHSMGTAHEATRGRWRLLWNGRPRVLNSSDSRGSPFADWFLTRFESVGPRCLKDLGGEWNLSLIDVSTGAIILATDRLGALPLFYEILGSRCNFGDSLPAMCSRESAELESQALIQYLTLRHIAGQRQLFNGVSRLLPGQLLELQPHGGVVESRLESYYAPPIGDARWGDLSAPEAVKQIQDVTAKEIEDGWEHHSRTTGGGMGLLFSSGLDSSYLLASLTTEQRRGIELATFGFKQQSSPDLDSAREVLAAFGGDLRWEPVTLDPADTLAAMDRVIRDTGFPVDHPNFLARHAAYQNLAARGAKTVIAGEGADTLLGGSWYVSISKVLLTRQIRRLMMLPPASLRILAAIRQRNAPQLRLAAERDWRKVCLMAKAYVPLEWLEEALAKWGGISMLNYPFHDSVLGTKSERDSMSAIYTLGLVANMSSELIAEQAMASSCGTYQWNPYLDGSFMDVTAPIPSGLKTKGWKAKHLLYLAAEGRVPESILRRRKCGSPAPLVEWFRDDRALGGLLDEIVAPHAFCRKVLERESVVPVVERFRKSPNAGDAEVLWVLVNLERWAAMMRERGVAVVTV